MTLLVVDLLVDSAIALTYCECGSLGCGIGYGYLHRIPTRSTESTSPKPFPPSGSSSPVKAPLPGAGFNEVKLVLDVLCELRLYCHRCSTYNQVIRVDDDDVLCDTE